jgi:hypothetical protein
MYFWIMNQRKETRTTQPFRITTLFYWDFENAHNKHENAHNKQNEPAHLPVIAKMIYSTYFAFISKH